LNGDFYRFLHNDEKDGQMDSQVLVAYATKYGATAEIAEKIGQVLRQAGLRTDVLPTNRVNDLTPYKAVVLGSAVYVGQWRKEAATFLKANEKALAERPVWLFSSGPTGEGDPVELMKGWRFPKALQPIADRIHARDIAIFHGVLDRKKLNLIERWMIKKVKAPLGDFRDWDAITSWATAIADVLKEAVS
jgi:menaquinone-dependent protoporphyrinogen oxidase